MKMPIQPINLETEIFIPNRIVEAVLETSTLGLNELARMDFTNDEREQFAQLIGYSLSGFSELNYVSDYTYSIAKAMLTEGSEEKARIKYLEDKLEILRKHVSAITLEMSRIHEDDLIS